MKTPDEIKKGLECCQDYQSCTKYDETQCPYYDVEGCVDTLLADALALIQQLQKDKDDLLEERELNDFLRDKVKQLEAERDAAVNDLENVCKLVSICNACKDRFEGGELCRGCFCSSHWQWRGIQKEDAP